MSSFYGGKEGRTYNIVQRYDSVAQMVEAFSGGGAYTGANYGQYVIIDTVLNSSRSNRENGLLYRRGFDYNQTIETVPVKQNTETDEEFQERWITYIENPGAGAIYVGQIVGPEGRTPEVSIQQWSDFLEQFDEQGTGAYGTANKVVLEQTTTGKTDDEIKVGYVNIRDAHGDTTGGYIAIDIPKLVVEAEVVNHDAYSTAGVVEDSGSANHPLWYKWNFTVPDGKRGADLNRLSIETGEETGEDEDAEGNPIVSEDEYLTYSIKDYTNNAAGALTEHLGCWPYRVIDHIDLINKQRNIITWPSSDGQNVNVSLGDLYHPFEGEYYWICVKSGEIAGNSNPATIEDFNSAEKMSNNIGYQDTFTSSQWRITRIPQTAPARSMTVDYKAGSDDNFLNSLRNVDYFAVDEKDRLYVFYSDRDEPYYLTSIGGLDFIELTNEGFVVHYKDGHTPSTFEFPQIDSIDFYKTNSDGSINYNAQDSILKVRYKNSNIENQEFEIKRIQSIKYDNTNLKSDQNVIVTYIDQPAGITQNINTSPIDMVRAIAKKGDNVYVLYANPATRNAIQQNGEEGKDWIKLNWTDPITNISYIDNNALVWKNFNSLDGQAQYHVYGEVTYNDLKTWLAQGFRDFTQDSEYSQHGDLSGKAGWLVTVNDDSGTTIVKRIYAFDYNSNDHQLPDETSTNWYEIFSLSASQINPELSVIIDTQTYDEQTESFIPTEHPEPLLTNMLWFVKSYGHDNY